jgi:tetraacyldisaccharide 4'-kinase
MSVPGTRTRAEDRLARRGGAVELLRVPAALFGAAARLRGALYDRGWLPSAELEVPVVCVGNLTAGGTGKTPMVVWLARELQRRGLCPGLLSRGYGRGSDETNDEARELERLLPGVLHVQNPDRVAGGYELVARGADAIVMDDGFQHRRLARDLDLVLVDATRPWGLPRPAAGGEPVRAYLPRGLLRERPEALARAGAAILTRVDQAQRADVDRLRDVLQRSAPGLPICETEHAPVRWRTPAGEVREPSRLAGRRVVLVSGIGNPEAFERTVRTLGAEVQDHRRFPDHHDYAANDLEGLVSVTTGERIVLTTAKDAVKCAALADVHVLEVELAVTSGAAVLEALIDALPPGRARRERGAYHEGLHG